MSLYSSNIINNAYYHDAINYNPIFYAQFENEAVRKYVVLENKTIQFKDPPASAKKVPFGRWLKATKNAEVPANYSFQTVAKRLSPENKLEKRKNSDLREFLYFKDFYMVKPFFTLGFRTVPKNEYHIITTTGKPLDLYILKEGLGKLNPLTYIDGYFSGNFQYMFTKQTLDANRTYIVYPDGQYLFITTTKCIFHFQAIKQTGLVTEETDSELKNTTSTENQDVSSEYQANTSGFDALITAFETITP